ncbi:MAG TPA: F0F1 ATP synthase subunit A [Bryobacteraceae bacterium]|jgi:F-type H+-transporting ATPase subunit a|nr:F0F1 ATP synthase subunit A [Bryobacteraceae bacterium]
MNEEIWITRLFNDHLASIGNVALNLVGWPSAPRPWTNYVCMELLVAAIIVVVFALLKSRLSVEKPSNFQQTFELMQEFVHSQGEEQIEHHSEKYIAFFGALFVFILFSNLIGVIPGFESPTKYPAVPLGLAVAAFLYYNVIGISTIGPVSYAKHFAGPLWWLAPLMIPIEIISHFARPLSLTVRLFANMYAGEQITMVFLGLTYFAVPAVFMGLHVFVSLIQAYVFMVLAMLYVGAAVAHEH